MRLLPLIACCILLTPFRAAGQQGVSPASARLTEPMLPQQLEPLARAIGDRRIVLLGENGHGVGEFTSLKTELVRWLHAELGFEVVAIESGFFECGHAWRRIRELTAREALHQCLRYPFQHSEILPLFELVRQRSTTGHPLVLAGVDPQAQGFDSRERPAVLHAALQPVRPELADQIAVLDTALFLPGEAGGQDDSIYAWVRTHGDSAAEAYASAAAVTDGWTQWVFRLAGGWLARLRARAEAEAAGAAERPAEYYALRDEWMARAVAALADSIAGPRKIIVWLHNDHARYGDFQLGGHSIRSVGGLLRDWYPDETFSIGLFMGRGTVADNSRRERTVIEPAPDGLEAWLAERVAPRGYVVIGKPDDAAAAWLHSPRPYLRIGLQRDTLVPAAEFDALLYVDSVAPPDYRIE